MYSELLAADNFISVNRKLASLYGLHAAVYIAEVSNIICKVVKKQVFDTEGFFKLDREYITARTTLTAEEQYTCDKALNKLSVLETDSANPDTIKVDMARLVSILLEEDTEVLTQLSKKIAATKADQVEAKKAAQQQSIKRNLEYADDEELQAAWHAWVDALYAKDRGVSAKRVKDFKAELLKYTTDRQVTLELLDRAARYGYIIFDNLVASYERDQVTAVTKSASKLGAQKKVTTVDTTQKF